MRLLTTAITALCLCTLPPLPTQAAETFDSFEAALQKGDKERAYNAPKAAITAFEAAFDLAANDTEKGLALSKKAEVLAFDIDDYSSARRIAEDSLALRDAAPVARVTAFHALAQCQIKQDDDPRAAITTLKQALALEGVEWARPGLLMSLGDCYRSTRREQQAVETYEDILELPDINERVRGTAYLNIGITQQYHLNNPAAARQAYEQAVQYFRGLASEVDDHLSRLP